MHLGHLGHVGHLRVLLHLGQARCLRGGGLGLSSSQRGRHLLLLHPAAPGRVREVAELAGGLVGASALGEEAAPLTGAVNVGEGPRGGELAGIIGDLALPQLHDQYQVPGVHLGGNFRRGRAVPSHLLHAAGVLPGGPEVHEPGVHVAAGLDALVDMIPELILKPGDVGGGVIQAGCAHAVVLTVRPLLLLGLLLGLRRGFGHSRGLLAHSLSGRRQDSGLRAA
mmetsp:Transcript_34631/g.90383  ORF Transcript_34631/g.90383 Transcript_34631/m.90383 type:complete len:224 (+) Transcript_34631:1060-1731(+)